MDSVHLLSREDKLQNGSSDAPIYRLSAEMLSEIFVDCLASEFGLACTTNAPLLLGLVCKTWRNVSLRTPELWASVELKVSILENQVARRLEEWFDRSGVLPISFRLRIGCPLRRREGLSDIIAILCQYSERWRRICIGVPLSYSSEIHTLQEKLSLGNSHLRDFDLEVFEDIVSDAPLSFHLTNLSNLVCLNLRLPPYFIIYPPQFQEPMQFLRHLRLSGRFNLSNLICLLQNSSAVESVHLCINKVEGIFTPVNDALSLSRLQHLTVNLCVDGRSLVTEVHGFFDALILPRLNRLEINYNHLYFFQDLASIVRLLDRSRPPLQILELRVRSNLFTNLMQKALQRNYLSECLCYAPDLRRLVLSAALIDTSLLLEALSNPSQVTRPNSSTTLPELRQL